MKEFPYANTLILIEEESLIIPVMFEQPRNWVKFLEVYDIIPSEPSS